MDFFKIGMFSSINFLIQIMLQSYIVFSDNYVVIIFSEEKL